MKFILIAFVVGDDRMSFKDQSIIIKTIEKEGQTKNKWLETSISASSHCANKLLIVYNIHLY